MFTEIIKQIRIAFTLLVLLAILTGLIYPIVVTGVAQALFPWRANGSLLERDNQPIGSELVGQNFTNPKYFFGRPSATEPFPYNPEDSSGSNFGPSNDGFLAIVQIRVMDFRKAHAKDEDLIPVDLVTASGSGLDPEISPLAAFYQVSRIAKARGISEQEIEKLIQTLMKQRTFGVLGEPRVNVLDLNLALDNCFVTKGKKHG